MEKPTLLFFEAPQRYKLPRGFSICYLEKKAAACYNRQARQKGGRHMENYELEYSTFIPVEVDTIIRQKAEAEKLPLNYASSILFELIIAGGRNKERIRQAYYYRRKRGLKITSNKYQTVRANFKLTYDDWEYLHDKVTNQEKDRLTTEAIREIIILWLENENWKMEVLSEYE